MENVKLENQKEPKPKEKHLLHKSSSHKPPFISLQITHHFISQNLYFHLQKPITQIFSLTFNSMSLRTRTKSTTATTPLDTSSESDAEEVQIQRIPTSSPSLQQRAITQTLASTAHLANLLPTGTLIAFQLLTPTFTNNGACDSVTRPMTKLLLALLAASCSLASFTDSFKSPDGQVYHGLATFKGMWLFDYPTGSSLPDLTKYRLRFIDGVHAVLSVFVFVAIALRDSNILNCFYPQPKHEIQEVLNITPLGIGIICSLLFMVFPTRRHGIGYPVSSGN